MLAIVWEYRVKQEGVTEFERIYSSDGLWTKLFERADGYLGTELLKDLSDSYRYVTLDRWTSAQHYEAFLSQWKTEYAALDARCEGLTHDEFLVGKWELLSSETR